MKEVKKQDISIKHIGEGHRKRLRERFLQSGRSTLVISGAYVEAIHPIAGSPG